MRIRPLEPNEAGFWARLLYSAAKRRFGKVLTPIKVQAHRPGLMWGFAAATIAMEFSKGADKIAKRLVTLRTAQIVGCPF
jgi:hypothetical protein